MPPVEQNSAFPERFSSVTFRHRPEGGGVKLFKKPTAATNLSLEQPRWHRSVRCVLSSVAGLMGLVMFGHRKDARVCVF